MKLVELTVHDLETFRDKVDLLQRLEGKGVSVISINKRNIPNEFDGAVELVYDIFYWEIPLAQMAMAGQ